MIPMMTYGARTTRPIWKNLEEFNALAKFGMKRHRARIISIEKEMMM